MSVWGSSLAQDEGTLECDKDGSRLKTGLAHVVEMKEINVYFHWPLFKYVISHSQ